MTAGGVCLQNLLFLSMPPRISARYLAMAWPFVAFVPLLVFGLWARARYALTAALCLLVLLPVTIAAPMLYGGEDRLPLDRLADADAVLIDNVGVGELPRFLWFVPGDAACSPARRSSSSPTSRSGPRPPCRSRPTT